MKEPKRRRRPNKTSPRTIELAEKRAEALEYRKQGFSYVAIGAAMGISGPYAYELVTGALREMVREPGEDIIAMELSRLDDMLTAIYGHAVKGDIAAIDRVLKVGERRAKILGLDAPDKTELTNPDGSLAPREIRFVSPELAAKRDD